MDTWHQFNYFPSSVYLLNKPEFLDDVRIVANEYLSKTKLDEIQRTYETDSFFHEKRIESFTNYVSITSWNILSSQGYLVNDRHTYFNEMWLQHYLKYGSSDTHTHPNGSYISGIYILEAPEKCSKMVLHDPRPGKVQMSFGYNTSKDILSSSDTVYLSLEPGMMFFINSWLPHSFTRNESDDPFSFVHFNLGIKNGE